MLSHYCFRWNFSELIEAGRHEIQINVLRSRYGPGSPLITAELREQAEFAQLSRTRVAREMKTLGLRCRLRMAKKPRTTQSDLTHRVVGNQLDRCFRTEAPNQVWVRDLTYLKWLDSRATWWSFWISSAERLSVGISVIPWKPAGLSGLCSKRCSPVGQQPVCWFIAIMEYRTVVKPSKSYYVGMPWGRVWVAREAVWTMQWLNPFSAILRPEWSKAVRFGMCGSYEEWCLNTLRFTMPGSVSIRAMVGRHRNSMKMNLRKKSAKPLNYESIFLDRTNTGLILTLYM